jgi:predicted ArsR family transcriptional regulator
MISIMMDVFGERQQELLKLLLKKKQGLSAEEIASGLSITRPAARQHLAALERLGYIEKGERIVTGGRPGQTYRLTKKGYDLFPKQYSWFSEVLLESLKTQMGSAALQEFMERLGNDVAAGAAQNVQGEDLKTRVEQVAKLMNDLAYQAETALTGRELPGDPPVIEATNCVFHAVAAKFPEICQFDIALLSKLTKADVIHEQCILRGGGTCRFRFKQKK